MIPIARSLCSLLFVATALTAGSVTYSYTGDPFSIYSGADNNAVETNISVSFTVPSLLIDVQGNIEPTSFEISDGSATLTDQSPDVTNQNTYFYVETLSTGQPYVWDVEVWQTEGPGWLWLVAELGSDNSETCNAGDFYGCSAYAGGAGEGYNNPAMPQPGWTITTTDTPEPSSGSMAIMGSLLLLAVPMGCGFKTHAFRLRSDRPWYPRGMFCYWKSRLTPGCGEDSPPHNFNGQLALSRSA